jgi:2-polyprenyl-3-methyl-5-hydroxy-6-metoxy-1,4-benzoquinol methylase
VGTLDTTSNYQRLKDNLQQFAAELRCLKESAKVDFEWYPYDTLANIGVLEAVVPPSHDLLFAAGTRVADIGAADGDLAFYLEAQGQQCDIYDYGPTNMNGLRAARFIKAARRSDVGIFELDLDLGFDLLGKYDLVLFLGMLYHLKNPFYALERLARSCRFIALSTRIARFFRVGGADMSESAAAYLLSPGECNNDPTNYWIFTEAGLRRILALAGWNIIEYRAFGDISASNPSAAENDERAFLFAESGLFGESADSHRASG